MFPVEPFGPGCNVVKCEGETFDIFKDASLLVWVVSQQHTTIFVSGITHLNKAVKSSIVQKCDLLSPSEHPACALG